MSKKKIVYKSKIWDYGVTGTITGVETSQEHQMSKPIHVGDVITFVRDGNLGMGMVVESDGVFGVMGYVSRGLKGFTESQIVIPYKQVTDEIAHSLHYFKLVETKKMTLKDIENKLGYPIEIVEE